MLLQLLIVASYSADTYGFYQSSESSCSTTKKYGPDHYEDIFLEDSIKGLQTLTIEICEPLTLKENLTLKVFNNNNKIILNGGSIKGTIVSNPGIILTYDKASTQTNLVMQCNFPGYYAGDRAVYSSMQTVPKKLIFELVQAPELPDEAFWPGSLIQVYNGDPDKLQVVCIPSSYVTPYGKYNLDPNTNKGFVLYSFTRSSAPLPPPTKAPPEPTKVPPEPTKAPPAPTKVPPAPTNVPPAPTNVPPAPTKVPPEPTKVPPAPTKVPPAPTNVPPAPTNVPPEPTKVPPEPTNVPPAPTNVPPEPTKVPPEPTKVPPTPTYPDSIPTKNEDYPITPVPGILIDKNQTWADQSEVPNNIDVSGNISLEMDGGVPFSIEIVSIDEHSNVMAQNLTITQEIFMSGKSSLSTDGDGKIEIVDNKTTILFESVKKSLPLMNLGSIGNYSKVPQKIEIIVDEDIDNNQPIIRGKTLNCEDWKKQTTLYGVFKEKYSLKCEITNTNSNKILDVSNDEVTLYLTKIGDSKGSGKKNGLEGGPIAGIVIAVLVVVAACIVGVIMYIKKRGFHNKDDDDDASDEAVSMP